MRLLSKNWLIYETAVIVLLGRMFLNTLLMHKPWRLLVSLQYNLLLLILNGYLMLLPIMLTAILCE